MQPLVQGCICGPNIALLGAGGGGGHRCYQPEYSPLCQSIIPGSYGLQAPVPWRSCVGAATARPPVYMPVTTASAQAHGGALGLQAPVLQQPGCIGAASFCAPVHRAKWGLQAPVPQCTGQHLRCNAKGCSAEAKSPKHPTAQSRRYTVWNNPEHIEDVLHTATGVNTACTGRWVFSLNSLSFSLHDRQNSGM